jgi:hypothetical protein
MMAVSQGKLAVSMAVRKNTYFVMCSFYATL